MDPTIKGRGEEEVRSTPPPPRPATGVQAKFPEMAVTLSRQPIKRLLYSVLSQNEEALS